MEITEVRVRHVQDATDRLKAFCTVTFDDQFVVRDIKVVEGGSGLFVSMPSRKATAACVKCGHRNQIRARFCEDCGGRMPPMEMPPVDANGRSKLHRDIAHPITPEFRELLQSRVLEAFMAEQQNAPTAEHDNDEEGEVAEETEEQAPQRAVSEYDDLIAGLRNGEESGRGRNDGPRDRMADFDHDTVGDRPAPGNLREPRPRTDGPPSRERGGIPPRTDSGDRGRPPRGMERPRSGEGAARGGEGASRSGMRSEGPPRPRGSEGGDRGRRPRDGVSPPPRRSGSSGPPRYLRDEQPPRTTESRPHGERGADRPVEKPAERPSERPSDRSAERPVERFADRPRPAPRETPRESPPRDFPRDLPKAPPPERISLEEPDRNLAVEPQTPDDETPFGAGL